MAADKFDCPVCGSVSTVTNTTVGIRETTRYRNCVSCHINFATVEHVKDTPRMRQLVGEETAKKLWPATPFQYRKPVPRRGKKWEKPTT